MSLDARAKRLFGDNEPTHVGSGWISGTVSVFLGVMAVGAVACFYFPVLLTSPDVRAVLPMPIVRTTIQLVIAAAFLLGFLSTLLRRRKVLGFVGIALAMTAALAGGGNIPYEGAVPSTPVYLGLDWFLLNLLLLAVVFVPLEKLWPQRKGVSAFRPGWTTDTVYFFVSHLLVQLSTLLTLMPAQVFFDWAIHPAVQDFVRSQPAMLQFVQCMLVADIAEYSIHRVFHRTRWLWPFHAVHHSSTEMDWLAGSRLHIVDIVLTRGLTFVPLFVLGFDTGPLYAYLVFVSVHAVFIHSNVSWKFPRWVENVIVTPRFHHWHHAIEHQAIDRNFAVHFPFIDKLMGTYYGPEGAWPTGYGIEGHPVPDGFGAQLVYPVRSKRDTPSVTRIVGLFLLLLAMPPAQLLAQSPAASARLDRHIDTERDRIAARLSRLAAIISPSGQEAERAQAVAAQMRAIGLTDVTIDTMPNVTGRIRGSLPDATRRAIVFIATLDDLAPVAEHQRNAPQPPFVRGDRVIGPGTNTSSTTAAVIAAASALIAAGIEPQHDLVFAAVAQEETGLLGMKALYAEWKSRADAFVDVLGDGRSITYGAIGIHWWRVWAYNQGGHTLSGGLPNTNQGIARAIDRILSIPQPPAAQRTVLNISMIRSGDVVNRKPDSAWFSVDIRSLDAAEITRNESAVRAVLDSVARETGTRFDMRPISQTAGGQIAGADTSRLLRSAVQNARALGVTPSLGNAGSSNLNVAIAGGTLAIGLGGERGGARAEPGEFADIPSMLRTAKLVARLAVAMGGQP